MHDPEVLAFAIPRPWPKRRKHSLGNGKRYWPSLIDIWHMEPGGADALTVCGKQRWKLHVHHWKVQVRPLQKLKRLLFERCELCGRGYSWGYAPTSHQWDSDPAPWFKITRRSFHSECSALHSARHSMKTYEYLLSFLTTEISVASRESRVAVVERLTGFGSQLEYYQRSRLQYALGYERGDDNNLRRKVERS